MMARSLMQALALAVMEMRSRRHECLTVEHLLLAMTREQLVTVLWRMEGEPQASQDLSSFPDAGSVSEFAQGAMPWAVKNGVISGQGNGNLDPTGRLDRSQAAVIFYRMYA